MHSIDQVRVKTDNVTRDFNIKENFLLKESWKKSLFLQKY